MMSAPDDDVCCSTGCPKCDPNYHTDTYWPAPAPFREAVALRTSVVDGITFGYFDSYGWFEIDADGRPIL